jgi:hypothetical protein
MNEQLILVVPLMYVVLQWAALSQMRDRWHMAAMLPAVLMGLSLLLVVVGIIVNLDIALVGLMVGLPAATAYLLVLWPLYIMLCRDKRRTTP